jgi:hypothetical protein
MEVFEHGQGRIVQAAQAGSLLHMPDLPGPEVQDTARYIQSVLDGQNPVPPAIELQVKHILHSLAL